MAAKDIDKGNRHVSDLGKVWAIVLKNWMILKRDKVRLIPMLMFPLIMITIYGSTANASIKYVPIAVVDYDNTQLSQGVISSIYSMQTFTIRNVLGSQDEAQRMIDDNTVKGAIIIPKGYADLVMSGKPAQISLIVDESNPTISQVAKAAASGLAAKLTAQYSSIKMAALTTRISMASSTLSPVIASLNYLSATPAQNKPADEAFTSAMSGVAQSKAMLSNAILAEQNTVGVPVDPADWSQTPEDYKSKGMLASLLGVQYAAASQISFYNSLTGEFSLVQGDTAIVYSTLNVARQAQAMKAATATAALSQVESAQSQVTVAMEQASSPSSSVSVKNIDPYGSGRSGLDFLMPNILALIIFQGAAAGLGRAIAGERENGSLTRVFLTPTSNLVIIMGTQLFYFVLEAVRSMFLIFLAIALFGITIHGSFLDILFIIGLYAVGATGVGMILSSMAKTQEQYQAISMVIILPTIFLSGVFFPIETLPPLLQGPANILPMAYAAQAFSAVMVKGLGLGGVIPQLTYLAVFGAATFAVTLMLFKRELV